MKRQTLLTITLLLSLFLSAIPARAASLTPEVTMDVKKSADTRATFNTTLEDIINTLPDGSHDASAGNQNQFSCLAEGWASDPDDRSIDLNVRILSDDEEVAQVVADVFRQDLADVGVCPDGTCSFRVDLWGLISPDTDHLITVQAQDAQTGEWSNIGDTPKTLNCSEVNVLPEGSHDFSEGTQNQFSCRAEGWTADPNDRNIDLAVRILSDGVEVAQTTADVFRPDLEDAGVCPGGTCSFVVDLWDLISRDTDHAITVQAQDAQTGEWSNVFNTPKTLNCFEAQAQTFIVNSTADSGDVIPGNGICDASTPGECTLRAAIMESNANPGADTINFNLPGSGPHTISPSYELDFISDPVIIDGTTQPGFSGTPIIELDGSGAGPDAHGLFIYAGSSTVRGLVINRFARTGIELEVNGGNVVQGNYIGTDVTGTLALGNGDYDGLLILTPNNTIGGTTLADRNIISGNKGQGLRMQGSEASGNIVQGNFIGVDSTGTVALGNGTECCHSGIVMHLGASNNLIGGSVPGAGNVISGNTADGITIADAGTVGNIIAGNFIGTDVTGTQDIGNTFDGVVMTDGTSDNLIGGTDVGAGNVLSGNGANGVAIYQVGTTGNLVQGNHIGTDVTGSLMLNNSGHGVAIAAGASNNLIGGTAPAAGNAILFNNASGVLLGSDAGTGNAILSNSIHANGDLGIDLGEDGVTLNDLFDMDGGSNNLQNFPFVTDVRNKGKGITIQGILVSAGNTTFQIQFFSDDACDPSGYGEGQTYLGSAWVTTPPVGRAQFKVTLQAPLANGTFVTATATDPANNTSEFSQCVRVSP
jgi:CSLREA domain-containing protein